MGDSKANKSETNARVESSDATDTNDAPSETTPSGIKTDAAQDDKKESSVKNVKSLGESSKVEENDGGLDVEYPKDDDQRSEDHHLDEQESETPGEDKVVESIPDKIDADPDTYSIELDDAGSNQTPIKQINDKNPSPVSIAILDGPNLLEPTGYFRFGVAILTLSSILLANMNRQAFNQALTEMILPEGQKRQDENDSRLEWTNIQAGELKSAFSTGYAIFMIPSARLGEIMGTKWIVFASTFGSGLCSVLVPYLAVHDHFTLMKISRFFMGVCQAGVAPALFAIVARWLSERESGLFLPLIKGGVSFGLLLGSASVGLFSWQATFYLCGGVALIMSAIWVFYVTSVPEDNRLMSQAELRYIQQQMQLRDGLKKRQSIAAAAVVADGLNQEQPNDATKTTRLQHYTNIFIAESKLWARIFLNWPVIGIMLVKWTMRLSTDAQTQYLADFFKKIHKLSKQDNSLVMCINYALQGILTIHIVWLVNYCLDKRSFGLNKTGIRRLFQCACNFGMAAAYILVTFDIKSLDVSLWAVVLLALSNILQSGADSMMPYDLSPTYCGTIMGVANSFANSAGILLPKIVAWTVGNDTSNPEKWTTLFWIVGAVIASGGFIFILLVKAKVQPFDPAYEQSLLRAKHQREQRLRERAEKEAEVIEMADFDKAKKKKQNDDNPGADADQLAQAGGDASNEQPTPRANPTPPKLKQLKFQEWRATRGIGAQEAKQ